jgi:rhodanese-related sulfurtransferase
MQITRISPQEAAEKLAEGWVYVDVRDELDFEAGHPRGAVNVPYSRDETRFVRNVRAKTNATRLVLGCNSGIVSVHAAEMLARAGFEVVEQRAGFDGLRGTFGQLEEPGWQRLGLPIDRDDDD